MLIEVRISNYGSGTDTQTRISVNNAKQETRRVEIQKKIDELVVLVDSVANGEPLAVEPNIDEFLGKK